MGYNEGYRWERRFSAGTRVAVDGIGLCLITTGENDWGVVTVTWKVKTPGYGPMGRSGMKTHTKAVHYSDLMSPEDYEYACWKGDAGPGKRLQEIVKEHNACES